MPFPRNRLSPVRPAALGALAAAMALAFGPAHAQNILPSHGVVTSGAASIGQFGGSMTVNQTSARAIVNWGSFSIGPANGVTFSQPNSSSAILNRVTGSTNSTIAGQAAGQRPGLSRQPERDRDHQDRRRSDRRRVCRFHAWHSRQRLQQGQSQLCRQWRFRGRLERRLDHGRAGRLRRPPRRHGRRIRASSRSRWARSPWVRASRRR